jgi:hypothetical protein
MEKEACPHCASEYTERVEIDGETWWVCHHQGCSGRVSGAKFYWRPGEGAPPKPPKEKKGKPAAEEEASDDEAAAEA